MTNDEVRRAELREIRAGSRRQVRMVVVKRVVRVETVVLFRRAIPVRRCGLDCVIMQPYRESLVQTVGWVAGMNACNVVISPF